MLYLLIIIVGVVIYIIYQKDKTIFNRKESSEDLLEKRFINGEIDEETYIKMKETLKK